MSHLITRSLAPRKLIVAAATAVFSIAVATSISANAEEATSTAGPATSAPTTGAAPTTRPTTAASEPEFFTDPAEVQRLAYAMDRRVVPTVLRWLTAEQDRVRVGNGSARLRVAINSAERMRLTEAVPYLIAINDRVYGAELVVRVVAVRAAIRIAPTYSRSLLFDVMNDEYLASEGYDRSANFDAAAALVTMDEQAGRDFLIEAYRGFLETIPPPAPPAGAANAKPGRVQRLNSNAVIVMIGLADAKLVDAVESLRAEYPATQQREHLDGMLDQLRANMRPVDENFALAEKDVPAEAEFEVIEKASDARSAAITAIGKIGGSEALDRLAALDRRLADEVERDPESRDLVRRPMPQGVVGDVLKTSPSAAVRRVHFMRECRMAVQSLCVRNAMALPELNRFAPLPATTTAAKTAPTSLPADPATTGPSTSPSTNPAATVANPATRPTSPPAPLDPEFLEAASARVFIGAGNSNISGRNVVYADFTGIAGDQPTERLLIGDQETFDKVRPLQPESIVLVTKQAGGRAIDRIEPVDVAPGEAAPNNYTFVETRRVKSGEWEHLAVVLRKLGRETIARIPNRTSDEGKTISDRRMTQRVERFRGGDVVTVRLRDVAGLTMVDGIARYEPSIAAEFLGTRTIGGEGGRRSFAVDLRVGRKRQTLTLPDLAEGGRGGGGSADGSPAPVLTAQLLQQMREGFWVRYVPGETPGAPIRDIWLDGARSEEPGGNRYFLLSGTISLRGELTEFGRRGQIYSGRRFGKEQDFLQGVLRVINKPELLPKDFPLDHANAIRQSSRYPRGDDGEAVSSGAVRDECLEAYKLLDAAKDDLARERAEQNLFLPLQKLMLQARRAENEQVIELKAVLSPTEFETVTDLGRSKPKPLLRPKKSTVPAAPKTDAPPTLPPSLPDTPADGVDPI